MDNKISHRKKTSYSLEKGIRILETSTRSFNFFMIQIEVPTTIGSGNYIFSLLDENHINYYKRQISIDLTNRTIITEGSHEDPLVIDDGTIYLCFQISESLLFTLEPKKYIVEFKNRKNELIYSSVLEDITAMKEKYFQENFSKLMDYKTLTTKDAILTLHLGSKNGIYSEDFFSQKKGNEFSFKHLIKEYEYIGIQYSYTDEIPEIEEKIIIVGQKGINLSGIYKTKNGEIITSPFGFLPEYQRVMEEWELKELNSLGELKEYYKNNRAYIFEISYDFISENYLKFNTYSQNGLYSLKKNRIKKLHTENSCCTNCPYRSECLQVVPSGLSNDLLKSNLGLEEHKECEIFSIIKEAKDILSSRYLEHQ